MSNLIWRVPNEIIAKINIGDTEDFKHYLVENQVTHINLKGVSPDHIEETAEIIAESTSIQTVDLSNNGLGEHGPATAEALEKLIPTPSLVCWKYNMPVGKDITQDQETKKLLDSAPDDVLSLTDQFVPKPSFKI